METPKDLTFADFLKNLDQLGKGEWITVYSTFDYEKELAEWPTFFCALIPEEKVEKCLSDNSWDISIGDGRPGFVSAGVYSRTGDDGIEPLVMQRSFHGMKESYQEISEEFRYYFNLYKDRLNSRYTLLDWNGDDEIVILVSKNEIKIKTRLVKEFLNVKKMRLALYFDIIRFSDKTLEELNIQSHHDKKRGDDFIYSIGASKSTGFDRNRKSQGFINGKKIIRGFGEYIPRFQGLEEQEKKYVDFIIGVDEDGKEILNTSDEERLANFFGKNKGAPQFITPVFFQKQVLTKYYSEPEKYSVDDGYLRCGGMWGLRMDNNNPDSVMVFLGDLGHLTYKEQLYWRTFNIATNGKMSYSAFKRNIEGEFTDPDSADLFFKQRYDSFQEVWYKKFGWKFFNDLSKEDEHHLKTLHIPLTNSQKEFDEQILSLTKIFIDSINEAEFQKGLQLPENPKGITKLEVFLRSQNVSFPGLIEFMRNLQELRSAGIAHLKGGKYEKIKKAFGIDTKNLSEIFQDILIDCIKVMNSFERHFCPSALN